MRPARGLLLPLAFALSLAALAALPAARQHPPLVAALLGAAASLVAWSAILLVTASRAGRRFGLHVVVRAQHYVQAGAQLSIFVYWGWYWREVYDAAPLIVAQLVFAYAFDMLLTWSRRDHYTLGFGPFPIIFSINLFLWFRPDWFYLQFLMVAVGFAVKELIRWNKDGRRVHIFNPSSFPLGVCSLILLLTGTTHLTSGVDISITQLYPPHILRRPQFSWTRIRGESDVKGGGGHGWVEASAGSGVGADGGSPEGDRSRRRRRGGWGGRLGARAAVEREPETGRGSAAAARRVA